MEQQTIKDDKLFYCVEILLHAHLPGSGGEIWWDLIYDFRDDELVQDRRFSDGLLLYRPDEHPEVFANEQRATDAFNEILQMKDEPWMPTPDGSGDMWLKGCWVVGIAPDSPTQSEIETWVADESDSHETLKIQRLLIVHPKDNPHDTGIFL